MDEKDVLHRLIQIQEGLRLGEEEAADLHAAVGGDGYEGGSKEVARAAHTSRRQE